MRRFLAQLVLFFSAPLWAAPLTVKGSDTMVILTQRWAETYMKQEPEARVQVTGGGTGTGIAALQNGSTDIATASRTIKPAEQEKIRARYGADAKGVPVAKDGVAFYVHESNPITSLTSAQLKAIFQGDIRRWSEVGGPDKRIVLYSRENSSGTYVFVKDHVLKEEDFAAEAQSLPGTAAVVNAVAQEPYAIGFGGGAYAKGVRELAVRVGDQNILPTKENIHSGNYPLSRDLLFYLPPHPSTQAQAFLAFCLSPTGQQVVTQAGYYPLR